VGVARFCAALSASEHDPEKDERVMTFRKNVIRRKRHQFKAGSGNAPA
jgi:hypothetical protein